MVLMEVVLEVVWRVVGETGRLRDDLNVFQPYILGPALISPDDHDSDCGIHVMHHKGHAADPPLPFVV
jgi:hypothetical protein